MPANNSVSQLTGAQLALWSYPGNSIPSGSQWTAVRTYYSSSSGGSYQVQSGGPQSGQGNDSVTVFYNSTTNQVAVGFKGTNNNQDGWSDVNDGGSGAWQNLAGDGSAAGGAVAAVASYISTNYPSAYVFATGDSLGGGMAQSYGVLYNASVFGFEALPISQAAQNQIEYQTGLSISDAISQWSNSGAEFNMTFQQGDPATAAFGFQSTGAYLLGSNGPGTASIYLPATNTMILNNSQASVEASQEMIAQADSNAGDGIGEAIAAAAAIEAALQSHLISNSVADLQNIQNGGGEGYTTSINTQPTDPTTSTYIGSLTTYANNATYNGGSPTTAPTSVSEPGGPAVGVSSVGSSANIQTYTVAPAGQPTQTIQVITGGNGATYNNAGGGSSYVVQLSGLNNIFNLSNASNLVLEGSATATLASGSTVDIDSVGSTLDATINGIATSPVTVNVLGSNQTVNLSGSYGDVNGSSITGTALNLSSGSNYNTINLGSGSVVSNDCIFNDIDTLDSTITNLANSSGTVVTGSSNAINNDANASMTVNGSSDAVTGTTGDVVTDEGGTNTFAGGSNYLVNLGQSGLDAVSDNSAIEFGLGSGVTSGELSFAAGDNDLVNTSGFTVNDAAGYTGGANIEFMGSNLHLTDDGQYGVGFSDGSGDTGGDVTLGASGLTAVGYSNGLDFGLGSGVTNGFLSLGQGIDDGLTTSGFAIHGYDSATADSVQLLGDNLGFIDDDSGGLKVTDGAGMSGGTDTLGVTNLNWQDDASGLTINDASGITGGNVQLDASNLGVTDDATGVISFTDSSGVSGGSVTFGVNNVNSQDDATGLIYNDASGITGGNVQFDASNLSLTDDATGGLGFSDESGASGGSIILDANNLHAVDASTGLTFTDASGDSGGVVDFGASGLSVTDAASGLIFGDNSGVTGGSIALTANNQAVTDQANGSTVNVGADTGDTVTASGTGITADLSNGVLDLGANSTQVTLDGTVNTVNAGATTGDSVTFGVNNSNDTFNGTDLTVTDGAGISGGTAGFENSGNTADLSGGIVNIDTNNLTETVGGSSDTVNSDWTGDTIGFNGTNDVADLSSGTVNVDGNTQSVTVNGSHDTANTIWTGDSIGFNGTGDTANISSGTVNYDNSGLTETVSGSSDTVNTGSWIDDTLDITGSGDTAHLNDGDVNVGASDIADVIGGGNTIDGASDSQITVSGTGDSAVTIDVNDATVTEAADSDVIVDGSGNTIDLGASAALTANGGDDVVNTGADDALTLSDTGGATDTVNANGLLGGSAADGQAAGIDVTSDSDANVYGSGNAIDAAAGSVVGTSGTGADADIVNSGDMDLNVGAGASASLVGIGSNDVNAGSGATIGDSAGSNEFLGSSYTIDQGSNGTAVSLDGQDLSLAANNIGVTIGAGDSSHVTGNDDSVIGGGSGAYLEILGSGDTATATDDTVNFVLGSSGEAMFGSEDDVLSGTNVSIVSGSGNDDSFGFNGDPDGGAGRSVEFLGDDDTANVNSGTVNFVWGSSGDAVYGSEDDVLSGTNVSITSGSGNDDAFGFNGDPDGGAGRTIDFQGLSDTADINSGTVNFESGSTSDTLSGSSDTVFLGASGNTSASLAANGNDDTFDYTGESSTAGFDDITVSGTGDTDNISGWGGSVTLLSSSSTLTLGGAEIYVTVDGSGDSALLGASQGAVQDDAAASGTSDTVTLGQYDSWGSASLFGTYDSTILSGADQSGTLSGSGDIATSNEPDATLVETGSADTTYLDTDDDLVELDDPDESVFSGDTSNSVEIYAQSGTLADVDSSTVVIEWDDTKSTLAGDHDDITDDENDDDVSVDGDYNTVYGNSTDKTDFTGGDYTDDTTDDGVGDSDGGDGGGDGGYDGYGGYGYDPIVLNLRGGPVKTVGLSGSLAKFDVLNNGHPIQTGWTTLGEGFLVFDPSDAPVTKESQLIGSFAALEKLDPTANGVLTPNDPLWSDLRVWEPSANGAFSAGDLYTLSQLGIASIGLTSTAVDQNSNGNTILRQGAFTYTNGAAGQMASVELSADVPTSEASHARDTEPVAAKLGNLVAAMGSFHPLEQSTALDPRPHATDTYPILAASHSG